MRENNSDTSVSADSDGLQTEAVSSAPPAAPAKRVRRRATAGIASPTVAESADTTESGTSEPAPTDSGTTDSGTVESAQAESVTPADQPAADVTAADEPAADEPVADKPKRRATRRRVGTKAAAAQEELPVVADEPPAPTPESTPIADELPADDAVEVAAVEDASVQASEIEASEIEPVENESPFARSLMPQLSHSDERAEEQVASSAPSAFNPFALFQAPEDIVVPVAARAAAPADDEDADTAAEAATAADDDDSDGAPRRRRGRRGRGRKGADDLDQPEIETDAASEQDKSNGEKAEKDKSGKADTGKADKAEPDKTKKKGKSAKASDAESDAKADSGRGADAGETDADGDTEGTSRRRRRRRRRGDDADDAPSTSASSADRVRGVSGSVRLEAKRQRRKEGRDQGRRRAPILTEAEFLARRESVTRQMVVRQQGERTQIAVLEDDVLVEHYVTLASEQSFAGGVYYGRVQNVLPSMEAAFIDIGKRRNAVLYAGEVNWDAAGLEGKQRNIEQALKAGDKVLVQVTKDPIGHKGARLTSQISLPGRYLVYVPGGSMTGISRKLPEGERQRLKDILRKIVPDGAGVIIRTAAEGASEEELTRDVNRLKAQWEVIEQKVADTKTKAPSVLYEEPDLAIRVVRDLFNEDFSSMMISGDEAWETISTYMGHVAPDLVERLSQYDGNRDVFAENRIDEQLAKALDRKVWLPSGGSLVIDHTEAMTVIDVNTGKFTGTGGNLEQTVTKNNLEAAEEIVRQLRLRDVGGIVVIDFIDMLLESNRELVLRRLTECLGRDRTKHQVAEVTSLGLVQMTRKRVGQGLLDAFSEPCAHCEGRGVIVHSEPIAKKTAPTTFENPPKRGRKNRPERETQRHTEEPKRDSTSQLSVIAAASKKEQADELGSDDPGADVGSETSADQAAAPGVTEATAAESNQQPTGEAGEGERRTRRPTARRRRAAVRPAGPPKSADSDG